MSGLTSGFGSGRISAGAALDPAEFETFRKFLQDACGIFLAENKQYLVTTRIRRILVEHKLDNLTQLINSMSNTRYCALRDQVIDAMTTNETFWFRDVYPFEHYRKTLLPELQQRNERGPIRIWCAACSSGQEPYSLSMVTEEYRRAGGALSRPVEITATDLSSSMLDQARQGVYDKMSMTRGLSKERMDLFFDKHSVHETWQIKSAIKNRVTFKSMNLMDAYSTMGKFDMIFCRNVLIYFSADLKEDILTRLNQSLKPDGYLFLGASEGLAGAASLFQMVHCSPGILYRPR